MNFSDQTFWVILCLCFGIIYPIRKVLVRAKKCPPSFDTWAILLTSLTLFYFASVQSFYIFLITLIFSYFGLKSAATATGLKRKLIVAAIVAFDLSFLIYYKYTGFIFSDLLHLSLPWSIGTIPPGISFYTFQIIAFVIDSLRTPKSIPKLIDATNFISFFPQVVAGPIERRAHLLPQIQKFEFVITLRSLEKAIPIIVLGLFFKMVLGDNLAEFTQSFRPFANNAYLIWLMNFLFGFRIYFDFTGYSLIAVGLGKLFNIDLTYNFRAPYVAQNIREFWQRWHITLSTWFKDYLYIPLGGNKVPWWAFNIMITFILSGLWHGAGINYIAWGALHGMYLVLYHWLKPHLNMKMAPLLSIFMNFVLVNFLWLFFYETNQNQLASKIYTLLNPMQYKLQYFKSALSTIVGNEQIVLSLFFIVTLSLVTIFIELANRKSINPYEFFYHPKITWGLIVLIVLLSNISGNSFIYFSF